MGWGELSPLGQDSPNGCVHHGDMMGLGDPRGLPGLGGSQLAQRYPRRGTQLPGPLLPLNTPLFMPQTCR